MSYILKTLSVDGESSLREKACENYECRSCGAKMVSVNFVNGILIQVFVTHGDQCTGVTDRSMRKTVEADCAGCRWSSNSGCTFEGKSDDRIAAMHFGE